MNDTRKSIEISEGVHRYYGIILLLADLVGLSALYLCSVWIRFPLDFASHVYPEVLVTLGIVGVLFLYVVGGYGSETDFVSLRYAAEHVIAFMFIGLTAPLLVYSLSTYTQTIKPGRLNVGLTILSFLLFSLVFRRFMGFSRWKFARQRFIYVIGDGPLAQSFYLRLKRLDWPFQLRFFAIDPARIGRPLLPGYGTSPTLYGDFQEALETAEGLEAVVVAEESQRLPRNLVNELLNLHLKRIQVQSLNAFCASFLKLVPLTEVTPGWVFEADLRLRERAIFCRVKRMLDVVIAMTGLIFLSPLFPLVALLIRLDSSGPVFFRQERVGRFGQTFTMYKFRTMREGAEYGDRYTADQDPRITRFGTFLRKHRIDEIPQLINVLRGEMSFIGPRAEWNLLVEDYQESIPYYDIRHAVRPGITGWAQVNYPYGSSIADTREKLSYDLYYVRHYSLFLDLSIILKTVFTVLNPLTLSSPIVPVDEGNRSYVETQDGGGPSPVSHR